MYVPPIPEKVTFDNQASETILERIFLLNKFIRHIAMTPHLLQSPEFEIFVGVSGSVADLVTIIKKDQIRCISLISRIEPFYFVQGTFLE